MPDTPDALTQTPEPDRPDLAFYPSTFIRQADHGEILAPIPGMLEGRLTLIASAGGVGKTTLCEQIVRHLSSGHRLGRFELPERPIGAWLLLLEDIEALTQDRSHRVARLGSLPEDQLAGDVGDDNVWYGYGEDWTISRLHDKLTEASGKGQLPGIVIIDHFRLIIGSQPSGVSPNDWERKNLRKLVTIAQNFGIHFIVLTHLNKVGSVSGTTELINTVDSAFVIEPSSESHDHAAMKCLKLRVSPPTDYALSKKHNGTWGFDDQMFVSENMARGIASDILSVIRDEGPKTLSDLCNSPRIPGQRAGIRYALDQCKRKGWVRTYRGHWEIVPGTGDTMLQPQETPPPMPPAPDTTPNPQSAESAEEDTWDPEPEPEGTPGFQGLAVLKESIKRSRMHPLPYVPVEQRGQIPWTLITEDMGGEPRARDWRREPDAGGRLVVLDRNGSYPSACSSVKLAPNKLLHTGPLAGYYPAHAGIYQIALPAWTEDHMPHPLGHMAYRRGIQLGEPVWISTPHMQLLTDLATKGRIQPPTILDSWTGRANGSLLEHFYKEAREARERLVLEGDQPYTDYKRSVSTALRLIWPKRARSPIWRPDWRVSIVAEASVRHWIAADKAVHIGAHLVQLSNVDEAIYWTPDGRAPATYRFGTGFGSVKVKED